MMESSDDESETLAQSVTNYHFVDDKDEPISFSVLPIQWRAGEKPDSINKAVFLNGIADDGIQKIYKQVTAWKFELLEEHPEVSVLSKEKNWIKLLKPRKIFEDTVRTILIMVHCLHLARKHPEISGKFLWDRLGKVFSSYEVRPCENDLMDHLPLIKAATKQDETLSKSKFLVAFLENPLKRKVFDEDAHVGVDARKSKFIVEDEELDEVIGDDGEDESDEETELFDSVCAICDNGGELLCCEGRCIRSFHATVDSGEESDCKSLGFSKAQVKAIQNFMCLNCQHKRHQCFACGKLGSSDKSSGAEVFHCVSATCGYFYHPVCVAKLLHPENEAEVEELQKKISEGESFTCPAHKCHVCKQGENKDIRELQFALCRRCPRAYHRKCLPRKISFDDVEEEDIITRAWDSLLPNNRVLIYCLKHKIDEDLGTPVRNHIIFPHFEEKKKKHSLDLLSRKRKAVAERRFVDTDDSPVERMKPKVPKGVMSSDVKRSASINKREILYSEKPRVPDASSKPIRGIVKYDKSSAEDRSRVSTGDKRLNRSETFKCKEKEVTNSRFELDAESKKRIKAMMEKTTSSITLEDVIKNHTIPSTTSYSSKAVLDKTITLGKVEGFVEAIRSALQKLEKGGNVEDAKAVCGPEIINQIIRWKSKMRVYLAPFLHGLRYTSFGRHFTKVDKLKEIVDKLHWYTQNGDMIVDFCCGANDFSWLMKQKLEETGKRCSFKNFDLIQPKNDFCFEKRDWMKVRPKELPRGSNLIMGLNPPFGVKAALANKFVDKALEFKPKLVILIVPPETERLDRKRSAYDLIWETNEQLSGKSFYLPGSVDVNDQQMDQWNVNPPLLYLWSRSDWTAKHKAIALKQGHISKGQKEPDVSGNYSEVQFSENYNDVQVSENYNALQFSEDMKISPIHDNREANQNDNLPEQNKEARSDGIMDMARKDRKESSLPKHRTEIHRLNPSNDRNRQDHSYRSKKLREDMEGEDRGKQSRRVAEIQLDPISLVAGQPSDALESHSDMVDSEDGARHFQSSPRVIGLESRRYTEMGTSLTETLDDITRRYSSEGVPLSSGATSWSVGRSNGQEYGVQSLDAQFPGHNNDSVGISGRTAYKSDLDGYRSQMDVHQILGRYGANADSPSPVTQFSALDAGFGRVGSLSSAPYRPLGLAHESSAMQRYAPRLDELNHSRMGGFGSQRPLGGDIGMFDSLGSQYAPGSRPAVHPNMSGFARGQPHPSQHQNPFG